MKTIYNEQELAKYRSEEDHFAIVISSISGCEDCKYHIENTKAIEHLFPDIEFIEYSMELPEDLPIFMFGGAPSTYLFINGVRVYEEHGVKQKLELVNIIKKWINL